MYQHDPYQTALYKKITNQSTLNAFNFHIDDFTEQNYKKNKEVIRGIIEKFVGVPTGGYISSWSFNDISGLNTKITSLKNNNRTEFYNLFDMLKADLVGPGEALLYYLIDDLTLSGHGKPYDAEYKNHKIEVKAAKIYNNKYIVGFGLGVPSTQADVINDLLNFAYDTKTTSSKTTSYIGRPILEKLKSIDKDRYESIRAKYARVTSSYFKDKIAIFFTGGETSTRGQLIGIKSIIDENDLDIHEYTRNVIKPMILK